MNEHQADTPQEQHSLFQEMTASTPDPAPELRMTIGLAAAHAFKATGLLWQAIESDGTIGITRSFAQDVESIGYVILYSLYKHAVEDSQVSATLRPELSKEFADLFSAANITGLLSERALRFSRDAGKSMPYLLAYLDNDTALGLCAHATFTFLANLNQTEMPGDEVDVLAIRVAKRFPMPGGMPYNEAYPLWIELLQEAALELPGAQGNAT